MKKTEEGVVTKHFDIFDKVCILDLPMEFGWQLRTYVNHKLVEVENWYF